MTYLGILFSNKPLPLHLKIEDETLNNGEPFDYPEPMSMLLGHDSFWDDSFNNQIEYMPPYHYSLLLPRIPKNFATEYPKQYFKRADFARKRILFLKSLIRQTGAELSYVYLYAGYVLKNEDFCNLDTIRLSEYDFSPGNESIELMLEFNKVYRLTI